MKRTRAEEILGEWGVRDVTPDSAHERARLEPDLEVNPLKEKQLTNIRTTSKDEAIRLTPPRQMTLEKSIAYIGDDELVEVTPKAIRLRKRVLNPSFRKKRIKDD